MAEGNSRTSSVTPTAPAPPLTRPRAGKAVKSAPVEPGAKDAPAPAELATFPELPGFRLIQELGRSPKGIIYKTRRLIEQDIVAVKLFRDATAKEPDFRQNLERNAENTFLLEHPGLVRCLGCLEAEGRLMLLMEYAKGEPLSRALQRNVRFLPPRALGIAMQCAEALHYAYQRRRFHGRLHPGDVILSEDEVRLPGVGLGERPEHPSWNAKDPHLFEPLIYTATEALPSKPLPVSDEGRRAMDLYSLGALLYHMLTGAPPFRGTDEGTILQERLSLQPAVARWPKGAEKTLPARAINLVERLLSADPTARGVYESVLAALDEALREAEGRPMPAPRVPSEPPPPLAPAEVPARMPNHLPGDGRGPAPLSALGAQPAPAVPPSSNYGQPRRGPVPDRARYQDDRRGERISTALLIGATGIVFASAMALAARVFIFGGPEKTPAAEVVPAASNPAQNHGQAPQPQFAQPSPADVQAESDAAKQLEHFKSFLQRGDAKDNMASLKVLDEIIRRTRADSATRMEAMILKAEMEERMAGGKGRTSGPAAQTAPHDAEEKVFQGLVAEAKDLAQQQRFGAALRKVQELPDALRMAPYTEKARQEAAQLEQQAKAAFADLSVEANKATQTGDFAKARALFQNVQARYELPTLVEEAGARIKAINAAEEAARVAKTAREAEAAKAGEMAELAQVAREAALKASTFQYAQAKEVLDKFTAKALDPETKKLAADHGKLVQDEAWFFTRCRARLKESIERDPKKASPLAGYNEKHELLFEITDFDEKGIVVVTKKGQVTGERVREWATINPTQHLETMKGVMDKDSAQEQLALAAMAFHRAAAADIQARGLAGETVADPEKLGKLKATVRDLKKYAEDALNAAVQSDGNARERANTQKQAAESLLLLMLTPTAK